MELNRNLTQLETELSINLTTQARVLAHVDGGSSLSAAKKTLIDLLIAQVSRQAMVELMKRGVKLQSRTEYFDVRSGQMKFRLLGSPINTGSTIVVVNNADTPRSWSDSGDVVNAKYVFPSGSGSTNVDPARAEAGELYIDYGLTAGVNTLKVTYTGGMAYATATPSGSDGVTGAGTAVFTSASAYFTSENVRAGDSLVISSGTNNQGTWTVSSVDSATQLTLTSNFNAAAETGLTWEITTAGLIGRYPTLVNAIDMQCLHMWQRRREYGLVSEGVAGMNWRYTGSVNWLPFVKRVLVTNFGR